MIENEHKEYIDCVKYVKEHKRYPLHTLLIFSKISSV